MRGHGAAATVAAKQRRFGLGSLLLGTLLVCGGIAGYAYFFQTDDQRALAVSALKTAAIPDATEAIKDEGSRAQKKVALQSPPARQSKRRRARRM